jgi:hypothetical protein
LDIITSDTAPFEGGYWVDGYEPHGSLTYPSGGGSWKGTGSPIVDIEGGRFFSSRPEAVAMAFQGHDRVLVQHRTESTWVSLGFEPLALAAGDVFGKGWDELIVLGKKGELAICNVVVSACEHYVVSGDFEALDVTAGDVDGDGFDEPIVLMGIGGKGYVFIVNLDSEETGQPESYQGFLSKRPIRIDAGDLNGDGRAEIVGLYDGGMWNWVNDGVAEYALDEGELRESGYWELKGDSQAVDLAVGDIGASGRASVMVLLDGRVVRVLRRTSPGAFELSFSGETTVSAAPNRIGTCDFDGDSPSADLVEGPFVIKGRLAPAVVMTLPPYVQGVSDGVSSAMYGDTRTVSESFGDTVSLKASASIGVGGNFPGGFSASMTASIAKSMSRTKTSTVSMSFGSRYSLSANPELHGQRYGAVAVTWACFHGYKYRVSDPRGVLSSDQGEFVVAVPVGGGTSLLSTARYNAMARAIDGNLPIVDVPFRAGHLEDYEREARTLDGQSIAADDLVFPNPPTLNVSDVGSVSGFLSVGETEVTGTATTTDLGVTGSLGVAGFTFGAGVGLGLGSSYSLSVGDAAMFNVTIPPVPDNPATPEDEYAQHVHSVTPWVYRQRYENAAGEQAGYYVLTYSARR